MINSLFIGNEYIRLFKGVELADIEQMQVFLLKSQEDTLMTILQIEINNAEALWHLIEEREGAWSKHVYSTECQRSAFLSPHLTCLNVLPACQPHLVVKLQITLRLSLTDEQQCIDGSIGSSLTDSKIIEAIESHIT